MKKQLEIQRFDVREAKWQDDGAVLSDIRRQVFIVEQSVPKEEEWDGRDQSSWHWLATDDAGKPIGTGRLLPDGQIGRMAVLAAYRGFGAGAAILERAVDKARRLGFERVYLNAQTHALAFYKKAGFIAEGDEFMEAGIPHYRMTRQLALPDDESQRLAAAGPAPEVDIQKFDAAEVTWASEGKIVKKLREAVFVREFGLPAVMAVDPEDEAALHWHAQLLDGRTVGAVRMDLGGNISRLAVIDDFRRQGVGRTLIELAIAKATRFGLGQVTVQGASTQDTFYRALGFEASSDSFEQFGLSLQQYVKILQHPNMYERPRMAVSGDDYAGNLVYRLGADNRLILLRKEEEFRNVILELCKQASQTIRIYSPLLEHKLFDSSALKEVCSSLARRNKYTRVEILVYDPHRMVKNGHALLDISRKLPSSIGIRIVDPELRQLDHEYVLADDYGYVYRHDHENFDGYANFNDLTECNRLGRAFKAAWESGLLDPNLRQLRI